MNVDTASPFDDARLLNTAYRQLVEIFCATHGRRPTPSAPTCPFAEIRVPIIVEV